MLNPFASGLTLLKGHFLRLEQLREDHFEDLARAAADERIWQYLAADGSTSQGFNSWFASTLELQHQRNLVAFAVILDKTNKSIGSTGFKNISIPHCRVGLGTTWLNPQFWGTGANSELTYLVLRYLFEDLSINRCEVRIHCGNSRNRNFMKTIGMVHEGILRQNWQGRGEQAVDLAVGSILSAEWPEVASKLLERLRQSVS
ncbi:GNAT family N-acetyltransferase [Aliirhizobium smilacinae]|uniref:GNAT family N-acetyltransferase n=1 Tax=Aliirhizobium smilacinae TaxID=1395944 RepID=A0A5C4XQ11_9HYPH|nr:GNAT family N-acetyltransferase [Rhizobium smilacinae]TNM65349.1 GNAT family N-acetyltransferase [Rhizobium smilacinae]